MAEGKISVYSQPDLKSTTDDALGNYLRGLSFKPDNTKLDVRLAIGYTAVIISAALFAADFKLGWEVTKPFTGVAVVAYMLLNGAFTYWTWFVEKGLVFEGTRDGQKLSIFAKVKKYDPTYYLTVTVATPGIPPNTINIQAPFTTWFTADGYFVAQPFQQWLATGVEIVGNADPKNASRDERDQLAAPSVDVSTVSNGSVDSSGIDKGKAARRTKKKA